MKRKTFGNKSPLLYFSLLLGLDKVQNIITSPVNSRIQGVLNIVVERIWCSEAIEGKDSRIATNDKLTNNV